MRFDHFDVTQQVKKKYALAVEPLCRKWNLTKSELDVLLFLYNNPEFDRAADIVAHRGMTKSHVSLSVSNLESRGLLLCSPDPTDRRVVHPKLSGAAVEIADQGRVAQQCFFGGIFEGLSREDIDLWQKILDRVCHNIKRLEAE